MQQHKQLGKLATSIVTICQSLFVNRLMIVRNARKKNRRLEIGPGGKRIDGFETLNIVGGRDVDYVLDAAKPLPFPDNSFSLIYASHILEHIPWYKTHEVLKEWVRILEPGGIIEIWVPDGLKICRAFVMAESQDSHEFLEDGWFKFNLEKDPCLWASGRIFTYGDGGGAINHPNWHHTIFSERYLIKLLQEAGTVNIQRMKHEEVRGYDHKWINMGLRGRKP